MWLDGLSYLRYWWIHHNTSYTSTNIETVSANIKALEPHKKIIHIVCSHLMHSLCKLTSFNLSIQAKCFINMASSPIDIASLKSFFSLDEYSFKKLFRLLRNAFPVIRMNPRLLLMSNKSDAIRNGLQHWNISSKHQLLSLKDPCLIQLNFDG